MSGWNTVVSDLVGTPFEWGARGPGKYDCLGIVDLTLERMGLPRPPNWLGWQADSNSDASAKMEASIADGVWEKVETPAPGDIAALSTHTRIHHIGVVTPYGILHTVRRFGAVVSTDAELRLSGYRRVEYYRWVG